MQSQLWEVKAHPGINGVYVSHVRRPHQRWAPWREAPQFVREYLALDAKGKIAETPDMAAFERYPEVTSLERKAGLYHNRYQVRVELPPTHRQPGARLHLSAISRDVETFAELGRAVYKYTDCGPWISAILADGTEVYYGSVEAQALSMQTVVRAVKVGSIVEGSDVEIGPYMVTRARDFWKTVEQVNREASDEWEIANEEEGNLGLDSTE